MEEADKNRWSTYRALINSRSVDDDSIHEMVHRFGVEILDRDFPYLLAVAKGLTKSEARTESRRRGLLEASAARPKSVVDPLSAALNNDALRRTLEALARLPDADARLLWWHALGHSDEEILELWRAAQLEPRDLSPAALRQRRSRARRLLRDEVGDVSD